MRRSVRDRDREREMETETERSKFWSELWKMMEFSNVKVTEPLRLVPWYMDMWKPYRGKYPEPTDAEYGLICEFLRPFSFERDDFVEDEEWKTAYKAIPNARQVLIEHLHQIRESKGYDVERCLYFFSYFDPNATSMDESLKERAILAANFAIDKINKTKSEKILKLVSLDKSVWIMPSRCFLLTLTVEELDDVKDDAAADPFKETCANAFCLKTIRAMVFDHNRFKLKEWKLKV